jgi:hypothetical protein
MGAVTNLIRLTKGRGPRAATSALKRCDRYVGIENMIDGEKSQMGTGNRKLGVGRLGVGRLGSV